MRNISRPTVALFLVAGALVPTVAHASADLSGVWVVTRYDREIRTTADIAPPLLPDAARLYEQRKVNLKRGDGSFDPVAKRCGAPGYPRLMMMPYAFEIAQNPGRLVFMFEWNRLYRRVDVNGPSRNADDLQFTGRSSAQWDGDTLVVNVQQVDETLLDASGMPHSAALRATERWRLLPDGRLENRIRFDDPKTFKAPWDTVVTYRRLPKGYELQENICLDRLKRTPGIEDTHFQTYPK